MVTAGRLLCPNGSGSLTFCSSAWVSALRSCFPGGQKDLSDLPCFSYWAETFFSAVKILSLFPYVPRSPIIFYSVCLGFDERQVTLSYSWLHSCQNLWLRNLKNLAIKLKWKRVSKYEGNLKSKIKSSISKINVLEIKYQTVLKCKDSKIVTQ